MKVNNDHDRHMKLSTFNRKKKIAMILMCVMTWEVGDGTKRHCCSELYLSGNVY